ncbi:recombinase family protein [Streptomyces sp. NPDC088762]|uniref:recombinase family protein n=1 Tax=Streptomyces sp. NPDC088762 TaxID=3365891 RepID=UPI00382D581D
MTAVLSTVKPPRALLVSRISVDRGDKSTSLQRQAEELTGWQESKGYALTHLVVDKAVSGSIDLHKRPSLGPWMTEEGLRAWDVMAVTTQDRIGRNDLHFLAFVKLIIDLEKRLVVLDDPGFDISTEDGRMIAYIKAIQAAKELKKIRERCTNTSRWLRNNGWWKGGNPPFAYLPEKVRGGRMVLVPDTKYAKILKWICEQIREGISPQSIAQQLNERGVLTWRDRLRELRLEEAARQEEEYTGLGVQGHLWNPNVVANIVRHPSIAGFLAFEGRIHEDDAGEPLMCTAFPILSESEWRTTVVCLDARSKPKPIEAPRIVLGSGGISLYAGIGSCRNCASAVYLHRTTKKLKSGTVVYANYRCHASARGVVCDFRAAVKQEEFEGFFEDTLLTATGHLPEVTKVWIPGEDHTEELERARRRLDQLETDYAEGVYDDDPPAYRRIRSLINEKVAKLELLPHRPSQYIYRETGRTWGEKWRSMNDLDRRAFLTQTGTRMVVWKEGYNPDHAGLVADLGDMKDLTAAAGTLSIDLKREAVRQHALSNVSKRQFLEMVKDGVLNQPRPLLRVA